MATSSTADKATAQGWDPAGSQARTLDTGLPTEQVSKRARAAETGLGAGLSADHHKDSPSFWNILLDCQVRGGPEASRAPGGWGRGELQYRPRPPGGAVAAGPQREPEPEPEREQVPGLKQTSCSKAEGPAADAVPRAGKDSLFLWAAQGRQSQRGRVPALVRVSPAGASLSATQGFGKSPAAPLLLCPAREAVSTEKLRREASGHLRHLRPGRRNLFTAGARRQGRVGVVKSWKRPALSVSEEHEHEPDSGSAGDMAVGGCVQDGGAPAVPGAWANTAASPWTDG
ncbi:uncharacterized protein [Struthio camelus]|uniref:uncharacterized protein n=1 Tax=Struthio camelus TaxID=8801 RepID=UPI003603D96E